LFRSFRSSGANTPARKRDGTLIDEAGAAQGLGHPEYRARHAQPDHDLGDSPEAGEVVESGVGTAGSAPGAGPDAGAGSGRAGEVDAPPAQVVETADEWAVGDQDGSDDFRFVVRPYSWTQGRTRPVQDLALETLVSTSDKGRDLTSICSAEHAAIAQLCTEIRSVAEVAALLSLPLGVARVLLADMIDTGLVHVHRNQMNWGDAPDLALLERVLDGLYRL
jgi:Protein of unknown function (DUF742)